MPTAEKAGTIEELRKRLGGATAAVLTEYRGLTVQQVSELRKQLEAASGGVPRRQEPAGARRHRGLGAGGPAPAPHGADRRRDRAEGPGRRWPRRSRGSPRRTRRSRSGSASSTASSGSAGAQGGGGPAVARGAPVAARGRDPGPAGAARRLAPGAAAGARIHSGRAGQQAPAESAVAGVTDGIGRTRTGPRGLADDKGDRG